jgi:hypothetical protein
MTALLNVCPDILTKIMLNQNNFQIFLIYNNLDQLGIGSDYHPDWKFRSSVGKEAVGTYYRARAAAVIFVAR